MGLLNLTVSTTIAILYNLFIHHLTSILFKNDSYEDKINKSIIMLLISGIGGIVSIKTLFSDDSKSGSSGSPGVVENGMWLGGILLILTSIFVNWSDMGDDIKLIMVFISLVALIYYSKKTLENGSNKQIKTSTSTRKLINSDDDNDLIDDIDKILEENK